MSDVCIAQADSLNDAAIPVTSEGSRKSGEFMKIGKNIGYGVAFFAILGFAVGLGVFLSIVLAQDISDLGDILMAIFGVFIFLVSGPIIAGFVGIMQGAASREKPGHAAGAGFVTGAAGYMIAALIIFIMMAMAISIKFPSDSDGSSSDSSSEEDVEDTGAFFRMVLQVLLPTSVSGGLVAFISAKVFSDPNVFTGEKEKAPQNLVAVGGPVPFTGSPPSTYSSTLQPAAPGQVFAPPSLGDWVCPNCGNRVLQGSVCPRCGYRQR